MRVKAQFAFDFLHVRYAMESESGGSLEKRGRTLEDEFFYRVDKELAERLRERLAAEERRASLAQISGLADEAILDALVEAQITGESFVALMLVPLTRVAWADGKMDAAERAAILEAAAATHCPDGSPGYELLKSWLNDPPPDRLYEAWQAYTRSLCTQLAPGVRENLRDQVVAQARKVAQAAGGILGLHKVSAAEEAVLEEIERVFHLGDA
jgi:hypothetical protein